MSAGIHPEDAHSYAVQLHEDMAALTRAVNALSGPLAMIAETIERDSDGEAAFRVAQSGAWPMTSYMVTP